jgi:hypothetical protein
VDDIGETAIPKPGILGGVRKFISQGKDNRTDLEFVLGFLFIKIDRTGGTDCLAAAATVAARHFIHDISIRQRARRHFVHGLADGQPHLERAGQRDRTYRVAHAAVDAPPGINEERATAQCDREIARVAGRVDQISIGQNLDVWMAIMIQKCRGNGRPGAAVAMV